MRFHSFLCSRFIVRIIGSLSTVRRCSVRASCALSIVMFSFCITVRFASFAVVKSSTVFFLGGGVEGGGSAGEISHHFVRELCINLKAVH